jgi:hypothetical protein
MRIHAAEHPLLVKALIDKRTGDEIHRGMDKESNKHLFEWWDPATKKGEYVLQDMHGHPVWYNTGIAPDFGILERVSAKFPHVKTILSIDKSLYETIKDMKHEQIGDNNYVLTIWDSIRQPDVEVEIRE